MYIGKVCSRIGCKHGGYSMSVLEDMGCYNVQGVREGRVTRFWELEVRCIRECLCIPYMSRWQGCGSCTNGGR